MPMVKKSITVTDQQEKWIQSQIASGNYGTDSELIREVLREKQMRMDEIEYIKARLIAAEQSDFTDQTPEEIRAEFKERLTRNGKL